MQSLLEQSQLQRTLSHLPEEMAEQYRLMGEKTQDLLKRQEGVESDLARSVFEDFQDLPYFEKWKDNIQSDFYITRSEVTK